jgi:hypothetical protein
MANEQKQQTAVEEFKLAVIASATEAVIKLMTPDQMRAFAEEILGLVLKDLAQPYGQFHKALSEQAGKAAVEYLNRPEVIQRVKQGVEEGVFLALNGLTAQSRGIIADQAQAALVKALTAPDLVRRY